MFSYWPPDMEKAIERIMEESYKGKLFDDLVMADYYWAGERLQEQLLPKEASLTNGLVTFMSTEGIEASYGRWMDWATSLQFIVTLPEEKRLQTLS